MRSKENVVGNRIKMFCEESKLSLEELAEKSGIAIEDLNMIINNSEIPSLSPLIKIARTLGVRLGTFLDGNESVGPTVCRKEENINSIRFQNTTNRAHMSYHSLSRAKQDRNMEPFIIDIDPIENQKYTLCTHEGEEFIYVLSGRIEVDYGDMKYELKEGDSIYYDSLVPHHLHTPEGGPAKILAVIYSPIQ
ncbi:MAG: XRE family transcriptional regulator [Bacteroidales bacterium]